MDTVEWFNEQEKTVMWLVSKMGFFSGVLTREDKNVVGVRARVKEDIDRLHAFCVEQGIDHGPIIVTPPPADYQFRILMNKAEWARVVALLAMGMDYTNFKSACHGSAAFHSALMDTWSTWLRYGRNAWHKSHPSNHPPVINGSRDTYRHPPVSQDITEQDQEGDAFETMDHDQDWGDLADVGEHDILFQPNRPPTKTEYKTGTPLSRDQSGAYWCPAGCGYQYGKCSHVTGGLHDVVYLTANGAVIANDRTRRGKDTKPTHKPPVAQAFYGAMGGRAAAAKLTPAERSEKARKAAQARWSKRKS